MFSSLSRSHLASRAERHCAWLLAVLSLTAGGCGDSYPTVRLPGHLSPFVVASASLTHDPLSSVLGRGRDPSNPQLTSADRLLLSRYLATLAALGPASTPELFHSGTDRLAYLVNAHVAWTLALHDTGGLAPAGSWNARRIGFPLDRGTTTLEALEQRLVGEAEREPRMILCLNPGVPGGPPLPTAALAGHSFDWQLLDHALRCGRTHGFWELLPEPPTLRVNAFTEYIPALADQRAARMQQLLDLVPPPPDLLAAITRQCGATLSRCKLGLVPLG